MTTAEIPPGLSANHLDALLKRGLTPEAIITAKFKSITHDDIKSILGFSPPPGPEARRLGLSGSPGVGIPFFDPNDPNKLRLSRFRLDFPAEISGKPAKYVSPKGAGNILYFPPGCAEKLSDVSVPIIITEGEFKALMAYQYGLFAVGLVGVYGWKTRGIDGQSEAIADLNLISWQGRTVIIVFDSDVTTNRHVQKARHELGKELYRREATVYAINLPPAADGSKQGLDDFLAACGLDAFQALDVFELPQTDIPPFTIGINEFLEGPEDPLEWGIEGIQPVGANGFRIADPKAGKSWLMLSEAFAMSTGQNFCGHFKVPARRRVLILEEEDTRRRTRRRLERIIAAHGGVRPSDEYFRISVKKGLRLDNSQWQEVLEYEIDKFRPDFVYLDVWNRLHSKDINSAEEMSSIVLFLDQLSREYGCAFIIIHHTRKTDGGGDKHNEIMGSRVLGGFSEATIFLKPTKEKGVIKVTVILKDEPEDGNFEPEFQVKITDTLDSMGTYFEYLGAPPERQASVELREKIKNYVLEHDEPVTAKQVGVGVGCSKPTAREHLSILVDLKIINKIKQGAAHYFCSPENGEK